MQTADQFSPSDTTYPIPIPSSGFNYSYWATIFLKITGGSFTSIDEVKFWAGTDQSWTLGTDGEIRIGNRDSGDIGHTMNSGYEVATGTQGTTGHDIDDGTNGHSFYNGQTTPILEIHHWTSGNKADVDTGAHTSAEACKAIVIQVKVDTDATQGEQTDETLYFSYDEI